MEKDFKKHYVYIHKMIHNNIPFYVGIGTKFYEDHQNPKMCYSRAYSLVGRTNFWKKIVNKYGYEIDIVLESNDYEYIKQKEIELIKFYGRRNLGLGTLCNLTDGGEGNKGVKRTKEFSENMSKIHKEKFNNGECVFSRPGFYDGLSDRMKNNKFRVGIKLTDEQKKNLSVMRLEKRVKRVIQEDLEGNFIKEWYTTMEVANYFGITYKAVWKACKNYSKKATCKGFLWKFKE